MSIFGTQNELIINADSHNLASGDQSWFGRMGETLDNAGKFATAATVSGISGIYNTGVAVGNFFGADAEEVNIYNKLSEMDTDLGRYYQENQTAIDAVGFIGTSFAPGLGGVKLYQAGSKALLAAKAGKLGLGTEMATGLLPAMQKKYLAQAVEEIGTSSHVFKLANSNYWKSLAAGAGEQFAQSAAFEVAVAATMFNAPVLKDESWGDIGKNILTGTLLGGTIGTAVEGATSWFKLTKAVQKVDQELKPFTQINELPEGAAEFHKLRNLAEQRLQAAVPILTKTGNEVLDTKKYNNTLRLYKEKQETLTNRINESAIKLAGGDVMLGRQFAADILKQSDMGYIDDALLGLTKISRVTDEVVEAAGGQLKQDMKVTTKAKGISFVHAADNTVESELLPRLADTLKKDEKIKFADDHIMVGSKRVDMYQYRVGAAGKKSDNRIPLFKSVADAAVDRMDVEARYMWALNKKVSAADLAFTSGEARSTLAIGDDLPMLERVEKYWQDYLQNSGGLKVEMEGGIVKDFRVKEELSDYITFKKMELVQELAGTGMPAGEIAQRVNVSKAFVIDPVQVMYGGADVQQHTRAMQHMFYQGDNTLVLNEWATPSHYKVEYDAAILGEYLPQQIKGDAYFRQLENNLAEEASAIANMVDPELNFLLPAISADDLATASRVGAGSGTFTSANGEYFSLASYAERVGAITAERGLKAKTDTYNSLQAAKISLAQDPKALMEFNMVDNAMRQFTEKFRMYSLPGLPGESPMQFLVPEAVLKQFDEAGAVAKESFDNFMANYWRNNSNGQGRSSWLLAGNSGGEQFGLNLRNLPKDLPISVPLSPKVGAWVQQHIAQNDSRLTSTQALMQHKGVPIADNKGTYYPAPINLDATPYYAFVRDPKLGGNGHVGVIFGRNAAELEEQIAKVDPTELQVIRKKQQEDLHKQALADYRWDLGIIERSVDSSLKRKGILHYYAPPLDSTKVLDDTLSWHGDKAEQLVREAVAAKYGKEIATLETMGRQLGAAETSMFGGITSKLIGKTEAQNPYLDYVKTMLNISRKSEFPIQTASKWIEQRFDDVWNGVRSNWAKIKNPYDDAAIAEFNDYAMQKGLGTPYADASMIALNDLPVQKNVLSKIVGKLNSFVSGSMLGMDALNAVNNTIGSTVLMSSEVKYLQNLAKDMPEIQKALQVATSTKIPGTDKWMASPAKLIAEATKNFFKDGKLVAGTMETPLIQGYRAKGFIGDELQRFRQMIYDASIQGSENFADLNGKVERVFETARKITGNKMAEDFTRFVAANIGDMLTQPLVKVGKLSQTQADVLVHSMVNKVNGNYLASQRASITQGALGQATTLFLTYQMNMIQQMFKYVGSGDKKAAITAMLAQGSMYGVQGLPGFNYLNAKVANAAGNDSNTDLYDIMQGTVNEEVFEWMMYGLGSNALGVINPGLKTNIYNRGDLNPRNAFLIPTDVANIPAVSITSRFAENIWNTAGAIKKGGDVTNSLLMGLEHNAINRPLAGLAQAINGRVTTGAGALMFDTGDLVSVANFTRIVGGQPLAESMSKDWLYRQQAYQAEDRAKLEEVGTAFKLAVQDGQTLSSEEFDSFLGQYVNAGGNQENFNSWMSSQMMKADESIFADIKEKLRSPFATYLQKELGGASLYSEPEVIPESQDVSQGQAEQAMTQQE